MINKLIFNRPNVAGPVLHTAPLLIRPSMKGGLCMSAGQKNRDVVVLVVVVVVVSKFKIRDVWLIQPCSRDR